MRPTPTRTLNPLPFQDLEPHRFEDLVRQLAYDYRDWASLEAIGRSGSDEGMDIRGVEQVRAEATSENEDADTTPPVAASRIWIFQCKREKTMSAARVRAAIAESLPTNSAAPHGFVLAAACDLSKKARDAFREEMVARGVQEFVAWARGELEDLLFQPRNDRLLFAYFGLSLQPRRRSLATSIRSRVALKKQLRSLFEGEDRGDRYLLLRDPTDERYPRTKAGDDAPGRWGLYQFVHMREPNQICILFREHLGWIAPDGERWDALLEHDVAAVMARSHLRGQHAWIDEERERGGRGSPHDFWNEYVPEAQRAYLKIMRYVALDRILAVDPIGDGYYPVPHIFVDGNGGADPFEPAESVHFSRPGTFGGGFDLRPTKKNRARLFPDPLPSTLHPPPSGFDHQPPPSAAALSVETSRALGAALEALKRRRADATAPGPEVKSASDDRLEPFRAWARDVALPVFDAFVREIRAAGQGARIVTDPERGAAAAIELRVALDAGHRHSDYQTPGHFRVSAFGYSGEVKVDVSPQIESGSRYGAPPAPKLVDLTRERLEKEIVQLLERVPAGR